MPQPTYQQGAERPWWWRVAEHLDSAHLASINAMVHNVDSQELVLAFQDKIREAQVLLLEIFRTKGLLPSAAPSSGDAPVPPGPPPPPAPTFPGVQPPPDIEAAAREVSPSEPSVVIVDQSEELEASEKAAAYEAAIAATPAPPGPPAPPPAPPVRDVTR